MVKGFDISTHGSCHWSFRSKRARMAPVPISPAGSPSASPDRSPAGTSEGTGFLCVVAGYDLACELAGSSGAGRIPVAERADGGHGALTDCRLVGFVIQVAVAALSQPVVGDDAPAAKTVTCLRGGLLSQAQPFFQPLDVNCRLPSRALNGVVHLSESVNCRSCPAVLRPAGQAIVHI